MAWRGSREEPVELAPDRIHVDRDAGVLEREQADPEGPLDERRPVRRRALREEPGETRVGEHEPLDDDPLAVEADAAGSSRRRAGSSGRGASDAENGMTVAFYAPIVVRCRDSLPVTARRRPAAGQDPRQDWSCPPDRTGPTLTARRGVEQHRHSIRRVPRTVVMPPITPIIGSRESSTPASESAPQMSAQPILVVIGIAIAVNLVIMGGLVVTLIARRRGRFATPDGHRRAGAVSLRRR